MVFLIHRSVPPELQPGAVVLAFTDLSVPWTEILGRSEEEIIDLLAGFFAGRNDLLELFRADTSEDGFIR